MKFATVTLLLFNIICCKGFILNGSLKWDKEDLVVCWEDTNILEKEEREYLHHEVFDKWDKKVAIDFIGWNLCSDTDFPDIIISNLTNAPVINEQQYGGFTDFLGMPINGQANTISIFFKDCKNPVLSSGDLSRCHRNNRRMLLHEFGHVMNLLHEQSRKDTPLWCTKKLLESGYEDQADLKEQEFIGPWSIDSIMNYCGNATVPDVWDILEVQKYYGVEWD